jgi:hypothetical protein
MLLLLLLVLLMTQAASSVCGAQCVQHQIPNPSAHGMAHCDSMQESESNGLALEACPAGVHSICAIDLQVNTKAETTSPLVLHADVCATALASDQDVPQPSPTPHQRSTTGSAPPITALRV